MIDFVRGNLIRKTLDSAVIDVSGVGYALKISAQASQSLPAAPTENISIFTYLHVTENALSLYGFASEAERETFLRIIGLNGAGPRIALAVLSTFTPQQFSQAVTSENEKELTKPAGVGKKMAQRMILELKGGFEKNPIVGALFTDEKVASDLSATVQDPNLDETVEALLSMGFTDTEIELAFRGYEGDRSNVGSALQFALKKLGGGL